MKIPQITFNEASVGTRQILPNIRNRIGIVGQFSRGPANVFSFSNGFTDFVNTYGSDTKSGSLGYQAAYDQGARDFGLVRVLGHGKPASGTAILSGTSTKDNLLTLDITGVRDLVLAGSTNFDMEVTNAESNYSGDSSGFYVVKVTKIDGVFNGTDYDTVEGIAELKYKFFSFNEAGDRLEALALFEEATKFDTLYLAYNPDVDTSSLPTTYPDVTFYGVGVNSTASGTAVSLGEGLNLKFGDEVNETLFLDEGDAFTFIAESYSHSIEFKKDETTVDITNRILSTLQGADPLGEVNINTEYLESEVDNYRTTLEFKLDSNIEGVSESKGNRYRYSWSLSKPDGSILLSNVAFDSATPTVLYSSDPDSLYLQPDDNLSIIEGASDITFDNIKVASVAESGSVAGLYEITLNAPLGGSSEGSVGTNLESSVLPLQVNFTSGLNTGFQITGYKESKAFTGGTDGPRNASRVFYSLGGIRIIEISAVSPGQWGNDLLINITPVTNTSYTIDVIDPKGNNFNPPIANESFTIDLTDSTALDSEGKILALEDSNLIRGSFLPGVANPNFNVNLLQLKPERLAPINTKLAGQDTNSVYHPSYFGSAKLQNVSLEGGYDGPTITEDDYVQAIKQLDGVNVNYIFMPNVYTNYPKAQTQLVSVAENSSELDGLKIAILNARPGLRPNAALKEFDFVNSQRSVLLASWCTYAGQSGVKRFGLSSDSIYAGKLATIGFTVSPAARSTAGPVRNITEVDTNKYSGRSSLQAYTDGRMEVLYSDLNLGGFYFLNGRTGSSDIAWNRIVVRRTYDIIRQDLYMGLQPYKSEPHTNLLRRQVETSVNAYFSNLARAGKIAAFGGAICNSSNNPPENYINGELNISASFLPLYSTDYINVSISRNTESGLSIDV